MLGGCANWPHERPQPEPQPESAQSLRVEAALRLLAEAMDSTPRERLSTWETLQASPASADRDLHLNLLQSLPGHPAYDPDRARAALEASLPQAEPGLDVLIRARLGEMRQLQNCQARALRLEQQLETIGAIEKQMQQSQDEETP